MVEVEINEETQRVITSRSISVLSVTRWVTLRGIILDVKLILKSINVGFDCLFGLDLNKGTNQTNLIDLD
jgi:hypothetical protein